MPDVDPVLRTARKSPGEEVWFLMASGHLVHGNIAEDQPGNSQDYLTLDLGKIEVHGEDLMDLPQWRVNLRHVEGWSGPHNKSGGAASF